MRFKPKRFKVLKACVGLKNYVGNKTTATVHFGDSCYLSTQNWNSKLEPIFINATKREVPIRTNVSVVFLWSFPLQTLETTFASYDLVTSRTQPRIQQCNS